MFDINNTFNLSFYFDFLKFKKKKTPTISIKIIKENVETYNHELNLQESFFFIIDDNFNLIHSQRPPSFLGKCFKQIKTLDVIFPENISNFYKSLITSNGIRVHKKMIIEINQERYLLVIEPLLQTPKSYASMICHIPYNNIELNVE